MFHRFRYSVLLFVMIVTSTFTPSASAQTTTFTGSDVQFDCLADMALTGCQVGGGSYGPLRISQATESDGQHYFKELFTGGTAPITTHFTLPAGELVGLPGYGLGFKPVPGVGTQVAFEVTATDANGNQAFSYVTINIIAPVPTMGYTPPVDQATVTPLPSTPTSTGTEPASTEPIAALGLTFKLCADDACSGITRDYDGYTVTWTVSPASASEPANAFASMALQSQMEWTYTGVIRDGVATAVTDDLPAGTYNVCASPVISGPNGDVQIASQPLCSVRTIGSDGTVDQGGPLPVLSVKPTPQPIVDINGHTVNVTVDSFTPALIINFGVGEYLTVFDTITTEGGVWIPNEGRGHYGYFYPQRGYEGTVSFQQPATSGTYTVNVTITNNPAGDLVVQDMYFVCTRPDLSAKCLESGEDYRINISYQGNAPSGSYTGEDLQYFFEAVVSYSSGPVRSERVSDIDPAIGIIQSELYYRSFVPNYDAATAAYGSTSFDVVFTDNDGNIATSTWHIMVVEGDSPWQPAGVVLPLEAQFCADVDCTQLTPQFDGRTATFTVTPLDPAAQLMASMAQLPPGSLSYTATVTSGRASTQSDPLEPGNYAVCLDNTLTGGDGPVDIATEPICTTVLITPFGSSSIPTALFAVQVQQAPGAPSPIPSNPGSVQPSPTPGGSAGTQPAQPGAGSGQSPSASAAVNNLPNTGTGSGMGTSGILLSVLTLAGGMMLGASQARKRNRMS